MFGSEIYGAPPSGLPRGGMQVLDVERGPGPLGSTRFQIDVRFGAEASFELLVYLPAATKAPRVFLGLNFGGNHTVHPDPAIRLPRAWIADWEETQVRDHRATEAGRGTRSRRWPLETLLARGYGLATVHAGDLAPDAPAHPQTDAFRSLFDPVPASWGTIGIWAWTLSRALDVLQGRLTSGPVILVGHSRLGKTALWASAQDERFAGVISNGSGCMGASLSRSLSGERVQDILKYFPYWFSPRLTAYIGREDLLPVDQHMLLALTAPRPLYVSSAAQDLWADPPGEYAAWREAADLYRLLENATLPPATMPACGQPLHLGKLGYHIREGQHDILPENWNHFLDFWDQQAL